MPCVANMNEPPFYWRVTSVMGVTRKDELVRITDLIEANPYIRPERADFLLPRIKTSHASCLVILPAQRPEKRRLWVVAAAAPDWHHAGRTISAGIFLG